MVSTEEEYKRSELVVKGRIIGADTVTETDGIWYDRHGVKYGKHKYSIHYATFLRIKLIVEKNYKSATQIPDTIYILTNQQSTACGYPFPPYIEQLQSPYYEFIIYGDRHIAYSVEDFTKRKKHIKQIKRTPSQNIFFTSSCRLTQNANAEELNKLEKLKT